MTPAKIKILMIIATFKHPDFPCIDINPTIGEIAELSGTSRTTVFEHMQILLKDGWLKKNKQVNSKRAYTLTPRAKSLLFETVLRDNDRIATKISDQFTAIINKYAQHGKHCGISNGECDCGLSDAIREFIQ